MYSDRRALLNTAAGLFMTSGVCTAQEQASYSDPVISDKWLMEWMSATKAAYGALHLIRFSDGLYALTRSIGWKPNNNHNSLKKVAVPKGFVTDFASIPRIFWSVLPKDGTYTYAAVIHDYLYWNQSATREIADQVFYECMLDFRVNSSQREAIYFAVRLGGGGVWDQNRKLQDSGEKRVIKVLPKDPTTSWDSWRKDSRNF